MSLWFKTTILKYICSTRGTRATAKDGNVKKKQNNFLELSIVKQNDNTGCKVYHNKILEGYFKSSLN